VKAPVARRGLRRRSFLAWVGGVMAAALLGPVAAAKPKPPRTLDVYGDTYSDTYGLRG
jgi:hypothetical protein